MKPRIGGPEREARAALAFLGNVFEGALRLLSPFMPFLTEEIWHAVYEGRPPKKSIALAQYPALDKKWLNDQAEEQMAVLQELIVAVRNMRAEMNVPQKQKTPSRIHAGANVQRLIEENRGMVERLANLEGIHLVEDALVHAPRARTQLNVE